MSKSIEVWDLKDLADEAMLITDDEYPCAGGPHCPRCRVAIAQEHLNTRFELPFDHGDGMVMLFVAGLPKRVPWSKEESDAEIRRRGEQ